MRLGLLFLLTFSLTALASSPGDAVACAAMDLRTVPPADRPAIRYHSLYAVPEKDRAFFLKPYAFHLNTLSRKAKLRPLSLAQAKENLNPLDLTRVITTDMVRIDTRHFKWPLDVYERLAQVEPYFREARVEFETKDVKVTKEWPGGVWPHDGKEYKAGAFKYEVVEKQRVAKQGKNLDGAIHLPNDDLAYLIKETRSRVPVVRADWFAVQTLVSENRVAGYVDFLEIKSRQDYFDLIGFSLETAKRRESELASIFQKSGVAVNNRQIYQFESAGAGYYQTRDVFDRQTKDKNAINSLNGDYSAHDAEEHYGFLPNRLFAVFLSDPKGKLQRRAPDKVGGDRTSTNNNLAIEKPLSCWRCHVEGLRPLNDFGRKLWHVGKDKEGTNILTSYSKEKLDRLESLYLRPLLQEVEDDNAKFSRALRQLNGPDWTPQKNAAAVKWLFETWHDTDVTPEIAARELGTTKEHLLKSLAKYASPVANGGLGQQVPNALVAFLRDPPLPMLREHFEEVFVPLQYVIRGAVVADAVEEKHKP